MLKDLKFLWNGIRYDIKIYDRDLFEKYWISKRDFLVLGFLMVGKYWRVFIVLICVDYIYIRI